jgi:phenylacetate-CoA ligase
VGDAGALLDGPCACGLSLPRMRLDGGKITGLIVAPDGRLCHGAVTSHVLRDEPGIKQFKTWQRSTRRFEIALVVDASYDPAAAGRIRDRYRRLFGPEVEVECKIVDRIPPDPSGKRRYVVSEVVEALG